MGAAASDVVIVGGGIAGGSLAYALASAGIAVTVLEATVEYEDRVRGESMQTRGVREAQTLGVDKIMLNAGAFAGPETVPPELIRPAILDTIRTA